MAAGDGQAAAPADRALAEAGAADRRRPVVVTLVHELAAAGCEPIVVVTGHLGEQVEALLAPLPYDASVRRCSRDAARLGGRGRARPRRAPPYVVSAADTRFASGDSARFAAAATGRRRRDRGAAAAGTTG